MGVVSRFLWFPSPTTAYRTDDPSTPHSEPPNNRGTEWTCAMDSSNRQNRLSEYFIKGGVILVMMLVRLLIVPCGRVVRYQLQLNFLPSPSPPFTFYINLFDSHGNASSGFHYIYLLALFVYANNVSKVLEGDSLSDEEFNRFYSNEWRSLCV